ncbi:MAG: NAD-dependent epimerase/dehydratase family protein [Psychromonas sp.]|nr:NAD-dependent epimerase/dehydratase family protein [Psychromonas sp.]
MSNSDSFKSLHCELQNTLTILSQKKYRILVTGAGGFLGSAICRILRLIDIDVVGFSRGDHPALNAIGVSLIKGNLNDLAAVCNALAGCDLVFHVASKAGMWGSKEIYFDTNVNGTNNVIQACKKHRIKYLVYTSTPSVTYTGHDENGIDESTPYATSFLNFYAQSKSIAEQNILKSNNKHLKTTAIRPHLIWGPGDPHFAPRIFERARAGKLKLVGKKDKLVDTTYIDNAVYAHLLAALELTNENSNCAGKAYFLSNDQPITMLDMINKLLKCGSLPPVKKRISKELAYFIGFILEKLYLLLNKKEEPILTRFVARQLSTSHYFNINAAKNDLGYQVLISIDKGMEIYKSILNR